MAIFSFKSSTPQAAITVEQNNANYPEWLKKLGNSANFVWDLFWKPFMFTWKFLARRTNLTFWIITAMVIGILIGNFAPEAGKAIAPLGQAFIRMITILEAPLIFSTLVVGIAGHGDDVGKVGKLAIKTIIYFEIVTTFALAVGLIMANLIKPGQGVVLQPGDTSALNGMLEAGKEISWDHEMFLIIPENFVKAVYENKILSIVFCAAMFSCAIMLSDKKSKKVMLDFNESLSLIMFKFVGLVMNFAPIGIGAALAATVGKNGIEVLANLGKLIGSLFASLVVFVLVILVPIMFMARIPIFGFFRAIGQPWLIAFSSASSESALPKAFENMRAFGCPNSLTAFVIPCGYSFNLDGTTLYLSLASIFAAQAGGMNLSIATQMSIMGTLMLSSKGVAAIPRASLVVLAGTVQQYGLPMEAVLAIMGVDAIMDMARTSINVFGNCLGCCVMSRVEGSFRGEIWREEEEERRHRALIGDDDEENASIISVQQHSQPLSDVVVHHTEKTDSVRAVEYEINQSKH
ncbi:hypothetical protein DFQ28_000229 [Apophysomyces sp. BC1034]|nr:hypothetical protein DFQ30_001386 [Apophysomyces sp. BC1015]KAG0180984.1 hypothetical protein DFQ29_009672 [Apophysomyces sp. BC1021]KAG0191407.1 hypothetical protein DFQ28_000229 [Apophysomyces sp. BC1034]